MPAQYEAIKKYYAAHGKSEEMAKRIASKIYVARGKGGSRSSRAKRLAKDR